jgi:hypothetical protein
VQKDEGVVVPCVLRGEVTFSSEPFFAGYEARLVVAGEGDDDPAVVVEQPPGEGVANRAELTPDAFADLDFQLPGLDVGRTRAGPQLGGVGGQLSAGL